MRILVDATPVVKAGGGICTYFLGLLRGWNAAGFSDEWRIVGSSALPGEVDEIIGNRGTVERRGDGSALQRVFAQQMLLPARSRRAGSWKPDVVLATTPVIPWVPVGAPVVAMVHDLRFLRHPREFRLLTRHYRRVVYRHGVRCADGLLTNSDFTRREVLEEVEDRRSDPQVAHLGADHVDRWSHLASASGHGITFAHWSNKRPDVAVRAWSLLADRCSGLSSTLHVVGCRGTTADGVEALARELGVSHLVHVHEFLEEHDYWTLFATASVVLMPSTTEGFGLPVLEAQRLGIPVVVSAVGGIGEIGGDAPLYVREPRAEGFADLCHQALFHPERRAAAIEAGRSHAARFTWRDTAETTRRELERAVAARRG